MLTPNYTNSPDIRILSLTWERIMGVERKNEENNEDTKDHSPDPSLGGISPSAGDRGRR